MRWLFSVGACMCVAYNTEKSCTVSIFRPTFEDFQAWQRGSEIEQNATYSCDISVCARTCNHSHIHTHTVSNCRVSRHVGLRKVIPVPLSDWTLSSVQICSRGYWLDNNDKPVNFFVVKSAAFLLISSASNFKKKSVHRLCLFFMLKKHVPFNMGDQKAGISTLERGVMQLMRHAADHV